MRITHILLLLSVMAAFGGCNRQWNRTYHEIETDSYTLTVYGQRLMRDKEVAAFPSQSIYCEGDTVRLQGNVTTVAQLLQDLSEDLYNTSEFPNFKGDYVLRLELIGRPGSDLESNATAALKQLAHWGYVQIDSNWHQPVALVHAGQPFDTNDKQNWYSFGGYDMVVAREMVDDSVGNGTVEETINGYMESVFGESSELFDFFLSHGYDTLQTAPAYQLVVAHGSRPYRPFRLLWPF